jgi:hypothetical protein
VTTTAVLAALAAMPRLTSARITVALAEVVSAFAAKHTWGVTGCVSFPTLKAAACERLARRIFDSFHEQNPDGCALERLEVRFARRWWDDRFQFSTVACGVSVSREGGEVRVEAGEGWADYLPV